MILSKRTTITIILFISITIMFCEEKIPEGPERTEVLEVSLFTENGRIDYAQENNWENRYRIPAKYMSQDDFDLLSQWKIPFGIKVKNDFDEAMDGKKKIVAKIDLWSANPDDKWYAQLMYSDTTSSRYFTIPPGDSLYLYTGNKLVWNQRDITGKSIHEVENYTPIWIDCTIFDSTFSEKPVEIVTWRTCDTTMLAPVDTVVSFYETKKIYAQADVQIFSNYHSVKSDTVEFNIHYYFPEHGFKKKFWCIAGKVIQGDPPCPFGRP